jgi:alkanesulfonate monooxygenase SsuD/methylene tetrahydromethanopterin reductase-like flavin-dependent oxidoreductase (luciferase family)
LVLRPKPRNRRGDFEAQITKPELPVLRPKPRNPPPPWFWGSTKKSTTGFEAKLGETIATSFEAKLEKTIATSFVAKPAKTVAAGFEFKPLETVQVVLRPNHSQTVDLGFEAQPRSMRS